MAEPIDELPTSELRTEEPTTDGPRPSRRHAPDTFALVVGLASLLVATMAIVGYVPELPGFDLRWLLAGGAALIGLLLLVSSLRRPRRNRDL